jgi:hypothetical protein
MPRRSYRLERYRAEATKEPFELVVDGIDGADGADTSIVITQPSGADLLAAEQATSSKEAIEILAGDQYDALMTVLRDEPAGVLKAVVADLRDHFGLGDTGK